MILSRANNSNIVQLKNHPLLKSKYTMQGNLSKMRATLGSPAQYQLPLGDQLLDLNPLIGQTLKLTFDGEINCDNCGRRTNCLLYTSDAADE